jgi:hypothetical protein
MKKIAMRVLALMVVCVLLVAYGKYVKARTIKSAELVECNGTEYVISFDGDEHIYTK